MKVSREQAAANRERVLDTAARLYRENGFGGIGVADIMKAAGLTHGGFYGQFGSKDELMAQAGERALNEARERWEVLLKDVPGDPFAAVSAAYLSPLHRDAPGAGCAIAALGPELARQSPPVRHAFTEGFRGLLELLAGLLPGRSKAARRDKALAAYAAMVGAVVLARMVDDPALSDEILRAVAASLPKGAAVEP